MKNFLFIFFSVFFMSTVFGQKLKKTLPPPPRMLTEKEMRREERNHECLHRNRLTRLARLKKYPFNSATQIQFVSFIYEGDVSVEEEAFSRLPILNDTVQYSKLKEIKKIDALQTDTLTDIFYNVGFRGDISQMYSLSCYNPRNAILFLDSTGKLVAYIEICFECEKTASSSRKISIGEVCNQKFDMIRKLFRNVGILHGTGEKN